MDADDVPVAPSEDAFARANPMAARGAQAAPPTSYGAKRGSSYRLDVRSPKRIRHPPAQQHAQPRGAEAFPRPPAELAQFPHDLSHNALETLFKESIGVQGGTPDGANKNGFDASIFHTPLNELGASHLFVNPRGGASALPIAGQDLPPVCTPGGDSALKKMAATADAGLFPPVFSARRRSQVCAAFVAAHVQDLMASCALETLHYGSNAQKLRGFELRDVTTAGAAGRALTQIRLCC